MLDKIIAASLRYRMAVLVAALTVGVLGLWTANQMPIDVLPDLDRPRVTVMTEAPGMVPQEVERRVTWPLEQGLVGANGVERVRSASGVGLSVINIEFDWGTDLYRARQIVAERLQLSISDMPPGVRPTLAPVSSILGQTQLIGFRTTDPELTADALRLRIDLDVRPRLLAIPGVAQVTSIGGQPTELQVLVNADRLRAFDVTLNEVEEAISRANVNATGGTVEIGAQGPLVQVAGRIERAEQLERGVVRASDVRPILIGDVATVELGPSSFPTGDAGIDGAKGVIVIITKQPGTDTLRLTESIGEELERIEADLPAGVEVIPDLFQQAAFIERAVDNVLEAVRDGGILVVIVLFLFLLNLRTTLITLLAIPLSIAVAALVFQAMGLGINTMTLGGLAVAIGTLVDDAIVDVENVYRRLRENRARSSPKPVLEIIFAASSEIRKPVVYGTLLVTVVYVPLFFLSGIEGRLFVPIGIAYIVSVSASLIIALTVTPVLCYFLLGSRKSSPNDSPEGSPNEERPLRGLTPWVQKRADRAISFALRFPMQILVVLVALTLVSVLVFATRGSTFLPDLNEGTFQVNVVLEPGTSLTVSDQFGQRLETALGSIEGVDHVARRTGRAPGDEHAMPVSISEAIVTLDPDVDVSREDLLKQIREQLDRELPGVVTSTEQPLKHLIDALLSGVTSTVAIKVSGDDMEVLRQVAEAVEGAVGGVAGVTDLYREPQVLIDQVEISPRREALAQFGIDVHDVAELISIALGSESVSQLQRERVSIPIVIRLRPEDRVDLDQLRTLPVRRPDGSTVTLGDLARVALTKTPNNINRENGVRQIVVQHNVSGRPLSEVVADVERVLEPIRERSSGVAIQLAGQFEARQDAMRIILVASLLSLLVMSILLFLHLGSARIAFLILISRPIAFLGAVGFVVMTGQIVSVATLVGLIALLGVSTRNAILLVDRVLQLMREERVPWGVELLRQAGRERVVPMLMTALTSGIGLVPLVLAPGQPGREILYPVASVIIGGLVTSTLLDTLITPALLWLFAREDAERMAESHSTKEADDAHAVPSPVR